MFMATPLDPAPPERKCRFTEFSRRARAAVSAGIGTLALAGAIIATPGAALAQGDELAEANAWVTDQIQAPEAWQTTKGEGVTVAVIDTGISEHPFFEGKNIERGFSVFAEEEDAWNDRDGHGTNVAAAVLSVAPEATILPVRDGTGADLADQGLTGGVGGEVEIEAIRWAVDSGADVLVMPWGVFGSEPREGFVEVVQYAIDKGVVVVASSGNDPDLEEIPYPASIAGVVAVAGTDETGGPWEGSTTGPEVVVAAPSSSMTVLAVQEEVIGWGDDTDQELYTASQGTSIGAGIASGVLALTLAADPELDGNNAIQRLVQTAGDGGGANRTEELGYGLINADQAVHAEDIGLVDENPLGYPMGEPGASGAEADEEATGSSESGVAEAGESDPATSAAEESGTGISTILIVVSAAILIGSAITVWLMLRNRGRKQTVATSQHGGVGGELGGYPPQQPGANLPQYGPSSSGSQIFGPPSSGGQQHYNSPPMNKGESGPPWGPGSDPNQRG